MDENLISWMKPGIMNHAISLIVGLLLSCISFGQTMKNWTILHYAAGSNSSEADLMSDIDEMKRGKVSADYNFIALVDRIQGFSNDSTTLDGNFTDTRLYQIDKDTFERLDGKEFFPKMKVNSSFEANMGDAKTLKSFIQYAKKYYPAMHYMLIMRSHGNGFAMCADGESGSVDRLYTAEISQVLGEEESVDILGLDVCSMAGLENLYQWRPGTQSFSANYVIASAPLSGAWAYDYILQRIGATSEDSVRLDSSYFTKSQEKILNPKTMTALELSQLVMEEVYDHQRWASWGLFDNSHITQVKEEIDSASRLLFLEKRETILALIDSSLGYYHNTSNNLEIAKLSFPYLDAYDFWKLICENSAFKSSTREQARKVCQSLDNLVISSYYGRGFLPVTDKFMEGKYGIYQIIPQGNLVFSQSGRPFWAHCNWFHPEDQSAQNNSYGNYAWCSDSAIKANNKVENFYELLDYLFDSDNVEKGGMNKYRY